jgi:hypothetical protein
VSTLTTVAASLRPSAVVYHASMPLPNAASLLALLASLLASTRSMWLVAQPLHTMHGHA